MVQRNMKEAIMEDFVQTPTITTGVLEVETPRDKNCLAAMFEKYGIPEEKEVKKFQLEFNNLTIKQIVHIIQHLPDECRAKMEVEYIKEIKGY